MALKNSQYDQIIRQYQKTQNQNRRLQDERIQEAVTRIPMLLEIDRQISSLSVSKARDLIEGKSISVDDLKKAIKDLGLKRTELLTEAGYPSNYLDPIYGCADCHDTGYTGSRKCHCFRQAVIDLLYTQSNIRDILNLENFEHFSFDYYSKEISNPATGLSSYDTMKKIVAECRLFISGFDTAPGNLFLYGDTGVGKTFLSHCIARELIDTTHSVIYFSAFELFDLLARNTFNRDADTRAMHPYVFECDLLIIDDLGTELTNSFVSSQLFLCINERLIRKKSTIISTNLPINTFADTYSERVFSRITSNYSMMKLFGDDIRIKKKLSGRKP